MTMISVSLNLLKLSPKNVRQTHTDADLEEMKASLLHHGLQQNLVCIISPEDTCYYEVIAGGRRLKALQALRAEGKTVPNIKDWQIPLRQVDSIDDATELSLVENTIRTAMHPADQFEAWYELTEEGKSAADIALRFGVEEQLVRKRMKLGKVTPELLQAFRENHMTLECLMAFTVTDDHARQLDVWNKIKDGHFHPHYIRRMLTEDAVRSTSKLAKFVGEAAYEVAGGIISRDLFEEDCYFENVALLEALAMKQLEQYAAEKQAQGWARTVIKTDSQEPDVENMRFMTREYVNAPEVLREQYEAQAHRFASLEHGTYEDEDTDEDTLTAEYEALEASLPTLQEQLASYLGYPEEIKENGTLVVSIANDGTVQEQAYVPFAQVHQVESNAVTSGDDDNTQGIIGATNNAADATAPQQPAESGGTFSQSLHHDLNVYRTQILQIAIAEDFDTSFDLMTFTLAQKVLADYSTHGYLSSPLDLSVTPFNHSTAQDDASFTKAGMQYQEQRDALSLDWMTISDDAKRYGAFCALSYTEKQALFSYVVSVMVQSSIHNPHAALSITATRLEVQPHQWWRPTESSFFKRLKKPQLLKLVDELLGETWLAKVADQKKGQLATWLGRVFEGNPSAISGMDGAALERIGQWLPDVMRLSDGAEEQEDTVFETPNDTPETADVSDNADEALPDWMQEDAA